MSENQQERIVGARDEVRVIRNDASAALALLLEAQCLFCDDPRVARNKTQAASHTMRGIERAAKLAADELWEISQGNEFR
jgi:hypothetical protein